MNGSIKEMTLRARIVLAGWAILVGCGSAVAGKSSPWLTDLPSAVALAREQGKPLLVVFRCQP